MMKTDDRIVTFESYYDPMLAHIVRTRLEANGIKCFIADETTLGANPLYNQAIGGVKLKIFECDMQQCRDILASEGKLYAEDNLSIDNETDTYVVCPYCGSTNVKNIISDDDNGAPGSLLNLISPFHTQNNWQCNNCLHEFE